MAQPVATSRSIESRRCEVCETPSTKQCGQCQVVYYCSKECQKRARVTHRAACEVFAQLRREVEGKGTFEDVKRITWHKMIPLETPIWRMRSEGAIRPLTQEQFWMMTGRPLREETCAHAEDLLAFYRNPPSLEAEVRIESAKLQQYVQHRPQTYLEQDADGALRVMAEEPIASGAVLFPRGVEICMQLGEHIHRSATCCTEPSIFFFRADVLRGAVLEEEANCALQFFINFAGLPSGQMVVAKRRIEAGEELTLKEPLLTGKVLDFPDRETEEWAMRRFVQNRLPRLNVNEVARSPLRDREEFKHLLNKEGLLFLLHLLDSLNAEETQKWFALPSVLSLMEEDKIHFLSKRFPAVAHLIREIHMVAPQLVFKLAELWRRWPEELFVLMVFEGMAKDTKAIEHFSQYRRSAEITAQLREWLSEEEKMPLSFDAIGEEIRHFAEPVRSFCWKMIRSAGEFAIKEKKWTQVLHLMEFAFGELKESKPEGAPSAATSDHKRK